MSFSQVKIYNLALNNLGVSTSIQSTSQQDVKTITLNNYYEVAIEKVLKDFDWNFASTIKELSLTGNDCLNPKYLYEFDYPNDCLSAREILSGIGENEYNEFEIITNSSGQRVLNTNINPAYLRYTRRVDNEELFNADFVLALSWYLAFLACSAITGNNSIQKQAYQIYIEKINEAKISNCCEGYEKEVVNVSWLDAR